MLKYKPKQKLKIKMLFIRVISLKLLPEFAIKVNQSQSLLRSRSLAFRQFHNIETNESLGNDRKIVSQKFLPDSEDKVNSTRLLIRKFKHFFSCSETEATNLVRRNKFLSEISLEQLSRNVEFLYEIEIKAETIMQNLWLLGLSESKKFCFERVVAFETLMLSF